MKNVFRYAVSLLLVMNLGSVVYASSSESEGPKLKKARITKQEIAQWLAIVSKKQQKQDKKIEQQRRTIAKQSRTINHLMNSSHNNCVITDVRIHDLDGRMSDQEDFAERSITKFDKMLKATDETFGHLDTNINALGARVLAQEYFSGRIATNCNANTDIDESESIRVEMRLSSLDRRVNNLEGRKQTVRYIQSQVNSSSSSAVALKNQSDSDSESAS